MGIGEALILWFSSWCFWWVLFFICWAIFWLWYRRSPFFIIAQIIVLQEPHCNAPKKISKLYVILYVVHHWCNTRATLGSNQNFWPDGSKSMLWVRPLIGYNPHTTTDYPFFYWLRALSTKQHSENISLYTLLKTKVTSWRCGAIYSTIYTKKLL